MNTEIMRNCSPDALWMYAPRVRVVSKRYLTDPRVVGIREEEVTVHRADGGTVDIGVVGDPVEILIVADGDEKVYVVRFNTVVFEHRQLIACQTPRLEISQYPSFGEERLMR